MESLVYPSIKTTKDVYLLVFDGMSKHLVGRMTWTRKFFETWTYSPEVPTPKINPGILSF